VIQQDQGEDDSDNRSLDLRSLLSSLKDEEACVEKIAEFVKCEFDHVLSLNEKSYLIIHLHNIVSRSHYSKST
jgi:hypothetical protein